VMIGELAPQYGHRPQDIDIKIIGSKPGEKLYEELLSLEETRRTLELDLYFAVLPAFRGIYRDITYEYPNLISSEVKNPYNSANEQALTPDDLRDFLMKNKLMEEDLEKMEHPKERY